jgi:hypothetical protein
MKSKDLQKVVFRKYEDGDGPNKIFRDLNGSLGLNTIKRWCEMILNTGSTQLSTSSGAPRFARTSKTIEKVKHKLDQKKMVLSLRFAKEYGISKSSAHRILTEDLGLHVYKMTIEPKLTEEQKNKRKNSLIGSVIIFEKRSRCASCSQMKKCLISTVYMGVSSLTGGPGFFIIAQLLFIIRNL